MKANSSVQLKIFEGEAIYHFSQVMTLTDLESGIRGNCFDSFENLCALGKMRVSVPERQDEDKATSLVCLVCCDTWFVLTLGGHLICGGHLIQSIHSW